MTSLAGARVMVTGGAGFIGSHLARAVVDAGAASVVVVDSLRYGDRANVASAPEVRLVEHTLGVDPIAALEPHFEGVDRLFHLAAEKHNQSKDSPERVFAANIVGTHDLYAAACRAGVRKILFTSSLYAYGRTTGGPFVETEVPEPRTVYGITKLAGEHLLRHFEQTNDLEWKVLRYLFVYGPKQWAGMGYKSVILKSFEHVFAGEPPTVYGDGQQQLDYVFVDDVVEATVAAMEAPISGRVFNVGSGQGTTVNTLIDTILEITGSSVGKVNAPADWTAGTRRVADIEEIRRTLGWRPKTSLERGLRRTYEWMAESRGAVLRSV